jgi:hypothetical protein
MRELLKEKEQQRTLFSGTFVRCGEKAGWKGKKEQTVLLENIKDARGIIVSDHLWFNLTKGFAVLGELKEGDVIQFKARVKKYIKGYRGYRDDVDKPIEEDYKLSNPTDIRKVEKKVVRLPKGQMVLEVE